MMLTEKECNEALDWLYALSVPCKEEVHEHRSSFLGEKYNLIKQLIEEHFSNPPLSYEEIEESHWYWHNKLKCWMKILNKDVCTAPVQLMENENGYIYFEENTFYRKEVKE